MGRAAYFNRHRIYVLTDMDNNEGRGPVDRAVRRVQGQGIDVHVGHLVPLSVKVVRQRGDCTASRLRARWRSLWIL